MPPQRRRPLSTSGPGWWRGALSAHRTRRREVVFTKNTTESLNLVAHSWGRANLRAGDAVLLTEMEHHSNIVPWMIISEELGGLDIRYIPIDDSGRLVLDDLDRLVDGVKLVGISAMSNVLGTINPLPYVAEVAHRAGAIVVADGAQLVPHAPVDVTALRSRLPRLLGAQDDGSDRPRRPVGPRRAARHHGAVPGRRRDDPRREARLLPPGPPTGPLRGGHAPDRRGGGADRGHRVPERHRDGPHTRPRARADEPRPGPAGREAGVRLSRLRATGG